LRFDYLIRDSERPTLSCNFADSNANYSGHWLKAFQKVEVFQTISFDQRNVINSLPINFMLMRSSDTLPVLLKAGLFQLI
jgi:hypothetical protein